MLPCAGLGISALPIFNMQQETVAQPSPEFGEMWRDYVLVDDLDGGVRRMRWRGEAYMPLEEREEVSQYRAKLSRAGLFPGVPSALDAVVSKPFSKPVTVEDLPSEFEPWVDNIDGEGSDLTQFTRDVMRAAVKHGKTHVLVDHTAGAEGAGTTKADDKGKRPISVHVLATDLLSWKSATMEDGTEGIVEVRIHEIRTNEETGKKEEFLKIIRPNDFEEHQNKAYRPPSYQLVTQRDNPLNESEFYDFREDRQQSWVVTTPITQFGPKDNPFRSVPLVTIYTKRTGFMTAKPALMDLAEVNLTHWQSAGDQRNIMHVVRVPLLFGTGFAGDDKDGGITLGAGAAMLTQADTARLQYVEHSGSAVGLGADDLDSLEQTMEILGVRPLIERSGDMTATGVAFAANDQNTDALAWLLSVQTGIEAMFDLWGHWAGVDTEDIDVNIFADFSVKMGDAGEIKTLMELQAAGKITKETELREIKRRGMFADGFDVPEELKALAGEEDVDPDPVVNPDDPASAADKDVKDKVWRVQPKGDTFAVVNDAGDEDSTHPTREEAQARVDELNASEGGTSDDDE